MSTFREDIKMGSKVPMMKTDDINDQAITKDKIRDGNVTSEKLAEGAVKSSAIADSSITASKIVDGSIDKYKLADLSVTTQKLADQSVSTGKIGDKSVTSQKIANEAITEDKIANESVTSDKIADGSIGAMKLADNSISADKLDKVLFALIKSATGADEDLLYQMAYLYKKIEGMTSITDEEIAQIVAGSYVPKDDDAPPVNPNTELKEQVAALTKIVDSLDVNDTNTRLKLQSFIDSYLTPTTIDEILK